MNGDKNGLKIIARTIISRVVATFRPEQRLVACFEDFSKNDQDRIRCWSDSDV